MTPRRPAPARPGARPGARRGARSSGRTDRGQTPDRAETTEPTSGRPPRPEGSARTGRSERPSRPERPGRAGRPERTVRPERPARPERAGGAARQDQEAPPEPHSVLRLGGADGMAVQVRILVLVMVLLLAFVVVFPSLRGYLSQRAQYDAVVDQVAEARATATALEDELARWQDDEYVASQARERLAYVMPGETTYVVIGAEQFEDDAATADAGEADAVHPPWFTVLRGSARVAGGAAQAQDAPNDPTQQGWSTSVPTAPTAVPTPAQDAEPNTSPTP